AARQVSAPPVPLKVSAAELPGPAALPETVSFLRADPADSAPSPGKCCRLAHHVRSSASLLAGTFCECLWYAGICRILTTQNRLRHPLHDAAPGRESQWMPPRPCLQ